MGAAREARTSKASPLVLEWAKTLTNQNAWPEGKSVEGFEKWLRSNFYKAQKESKDLSKLLGIPHDAGHASQGANTLSNLAPQLRFGPDGNRDLVDRTTGQQIARALEHVRLRRDLMDVDADFYLSQAFESYLNKGTIDPKTQLNLADFSAKYRQMILHDRSFPTAAAAEAKAQLLRLEEAFREQEGWLDGNPVIEDFRVGTAEAESGRVKTYNDPNVKNPPSVTVEYDYNTPEGNVVRAKEQRPQFASGIIPEKGVLERSKNGFVSFAKKAVDNPVARAGARVAAPAAGGLALTLGLADTAAQAQAFIEDPTLTKAVGLGASVTANVTDGLGFVPGPHTPAVETVGLAAEGLNLTMAERARQEAQGEPYFGPEKEEEQFDPNKTNYGNLVNELGNQPQ